MIQTIICYTFLDRMKFVYPPACFPRIGMKCALLPIQACHEGGDTQKVVYSERGGPQSVGGGREMAFCESVESHDGTVRSNDARCESHAPKFCTRSAGTLAVRFKAVLELGNGEAPHSWFCVAGMENLRWYSSKGIQPVISGGNVDNSSFVRPPAIRTCPSRIATVNGSQSKTDDAGSLPKGHGLTSVANPFFGAKIRLQYSRAASTVSLTSTGLSPERRPMATTARLALSGLFDKAIVAAISRALASTGRFVSMMRASNGAKGVRLY